MLVTTAAGTWGISGAQFLWGYGALCAATAAGVWQTYRQAMGPPAGPTEPLPDLSASEIGLLNEGPGCAITAATARLYYDRVVHGADGTLTVTGELDATADPVEREVYDVVRREPWLSVSQVLERVRDSASVQTLSEQLSRAGLLLDARQMRHIRLLWIVPALVTTIGVLRILAGLADDRPILALAVMTAVAAMATARLVVLWPEATRRGQQLLERLRGASDPAERQSSSTQIALTAALFGAGTLWLAESEIASALGVPREEDRSVGNGGGGGCGGGGCGGCGGGGCGG